MQKVTWPVALVIVAAIAGIVTMYYFVPEADGQTRSVIITAVMGLVGAIQVYFSRKNKDDE